MRSVKDFVIGALGVWEGTYTHLDAEGTIIERFASRQEVRFENGRWYERITYHRNGQAPEVLDFRGRFEGDRLVFDAADFHGEASMVDDGLMIFPYRWKARPHEQVIETVTMPRPGAKVRLWQRFDHGELTRVTVINEVFREHETPDPWV